MTAKILIECFNDEDILAAAAAILESRIRRSTVFDSPSVVKDYIRANIGGAEREHFQVIFTDAQHRLIESVIMFSGTLTQTSIYPREVVKKALELNASAVILAHNHPSGMVEPSRADELLTKTLKDALQLIDVRVLDHIIVGTHGTCSFVERGLL